jgi:hypothetical protein
MVVALCLVVADALWTVDPSRPSDLSCLHVRIAVESASQSGVAWIFHDITSPLNLSVDRSPVKARTDRFFSAPTVGVRRF